MEPEQDSFKYRGMRQRLVQLLKTRNISDATVLEAFAQVPRHLFVDQALREQANADIALPIEAGQTISQPYTIAWQLQSLELGPRSRVLEIGSGSGYQTALLAQMGHQVFAIERIQELYLLARKRLQELQYKANLKLGDGSMGWPEMAPFDAIVVAAACPSLPLPLLQQLAIGGRMVAPVGSRSEQQMTLVRRTAEDGFEQKKLAGFRFVPLIGRHGWDVE